ncbi:MAG: type II secretion system F family protein [Opitutaceae bacterium]|nr:type II secretion system F family protein [Opitutaceae bacterium]
MGQPSDKNVSSWFYELSESLASGFEASEAVGLSDGIPKKMKNSLVAHFERGSSWSDALAAECGFLESGERSILYAAERSGSLPEAFKELGGFRKESATFKSRIRLASIYPFVLLHFGAFVFPTDYLWKGEIEAYLVAVGMILIPLWSLGALLMIGFRVSPKFKKGFQRCIPIIRGFSINRDLARFCRTFSVCIRSGMSIDSCWQLSLDAANNGQMDRDGAAVIRAIKAGGPASEGMPEKGAFPRELRQLYKVGERTGALDENIARGAELYSSQARKKLTVATFVYPQMLFAVIALFVAVKVILFYKGYFDGILKILE